MITAVCLLAFVLAVQGDSDQRGNVYALVFDDSNLFKIDKLPGWDVDIGTRNTGY
jgi:hypothetical protein